MDITDSIITDITNDYIKTLMSQIEEEKAKIRMEGEKLKQEIKILKEELKNETRTKELIEIKKNEESRMLKEQLEKTVSQLYNVVNKTFYEKFDKAYHEKFRLHEVISPQIRAIAKKVCDEIYSEIK